MSEKTYFNSESAALATAVSKFSREELEMMVLEYADVLFYIRQALPEKGLLNADLAGEIEYIVKESATLKARIAELEAQVAELSKDKARLHGLIKIMSTDNGNHFCFGPVDGSWDLVCMDYISRYPISTGESQIEAIDAAIAKEQEGERKQ